MSSRFTEFQELRSRLGRRLQEAGYEVIDLDDGRAVPLSAVGRSIEESRAQTAWCSSMVRPTPTVTTQPS